MASAVEWAKPGSLDLVETLEYIGRDSPMYAAIFLERVDSVAASLTSFPLRGRMVPELNDPNIRELLLDNYRLIYEVGGDTIWILGLIHGARDLAALWEREGR